MFGIYGNDKPSQALIHMIKYTPPPPENITNQQQQQISGLKSSFAWSGIIKIVFCLLKFSPSVNPIKNVLHHIDI